MLSIRRLLQLIAIAVFIGVAFLLLTISNNSNNEGKNIYVDSHIHLITSGKLPMNSNNQEYLVVSNKETPTEKLIQQNIVSTLSSMKLHFKTVTTITEIDLNSNPTVIFSVAQISNCGNIMGLISNYIGSGGKVLFAAGIPEGKQDSYLYPVWGIVDYPGNRKITNNFEVSSDFLPYSAVSVTFKGNNASTVLPLGPNTKVFVRSKDGLPVIYSNLFNDFKTVIINGDLLKEKYASGFFSASLGALKGDLLYPIIGTKTVFIDAFPPIANIDDTRTTNLYGRSTEAFLRDVFWPQLLSTQIVNNLKYTASILTIIPKYYDTSQINKRLFTFIFHEIINRKGEIIISGDHSKESSLTSEQMKEAKAFFKNSFSNYQFNAYSVLFGNPNKETLKLITDNFDESKIIVGVLNGDPKTQFTHDFGEDESYIYFPSVSNGFTGEDGATFDFLSALTSKGVVSHSFNIESLLKNYDNKSKWDDVKIKFSELSKNFFEKTSWLKSATVSDASNNVKAYSRLKTNITESSSEIKVFCDNFMVNQTFMLRSDREIKEVVGGSFNKISDSYYQIIAETPSFTVVFA
ncbi:MAG: DUF2194 domain-containing protein [Bacillota bacterium]